MKNILFIALALLLSGCAFKAMYGFQFEYESHDAMSETMGKTEEHAEDEEH